MATPPGGTSARSGPPAVLVFPSPSVSDPTWINTAGRLDDKPELDQEANNWLGTGVQNFVGDEGLRITQPGGASPALLTVSYFGSYSTQSNTSDTVIINSGFCPCCSGSGMGGPCICLSWPPEVCVYLSNLGEDYFPSCEPNPSCVELACLNDIPLTMSLQASPPLPSFSYFGTGVVPGCIVTISFISGTLCYRATWQCLALSSPPTLHVYLYPCSYGWPPPMFGYWVLGFPIACTPVLSGTDGTGWDGTGTCSPLNLPMNGTALWNLGTPCRGVVPGPYGKLINIRLGACPLGMKSQSQFVEETRTAILPGKIPKCKRIGNKAVGLRDCPTCKGNVRQKEFVCSAGYGIGGKVVPLLDCGPRCPGYLPESSP